MSLLKTNEAKTKTYHVITGAEACWNVVADTETFEPTVTGKNILTLKDSEGNLIGTFLNIIGFYVDYS